MPQQFPSLQPDPNLTPVTAELVDNVARIMCEADGDDYDGDEVLFYMALAVASLELALVNSRAETINVRSELLEFRTEFLNLKTDLIEAGLRFS